MDEYKKQYDYMNHHMNIMEEYKKEYENNVKELYDLVHAFISSEEHYNKIDDVTNKYVLNRAKYKESSSILASNFDVINRLPYNVAKHFKDIAIRYNECRGIEFVKIIETL